MIKKTLVIGIAILLLLTGCGKSHRPNRDNLCFTPGIKYDTATLSGIIMGFPTIDKKFKKAELVISRVVTGDRSILEAAINNDGSFTFIVPIQCISLATIAIDNNFVITCLIPGEVTKLQIGFDGNKLKPVRIDNSVGFTAEDATVISIWPWALPNIENEIISPEEFSKRVIGGIPDVLKPVENYSGLSKPAKQILSAEIKLMCIYYDLFDYKGFIKKAYAQKPTSDSSQMQYQEPGRSYYSFLKYFDLNDPSYLTAGFYPMIIQNILSNETLAIPDIKEIKVDTWLDKVKEQLKDYIGTERGLFFDLLVSNAYAKQINNKTPLSEIQLQNIKSYFTNPSFIKILTLKNDEALKLMSTSKARKINVSSPGNVMDSIISRYNGKVVFVDFWATWCGPCQLAMKKSESVRKDFERKDVAFVYVTDPSSPRNIWDQQILEIGGDHYYVTENEWSYLTRIYGFTAIPHYLIFDKTGRLKYNYHTFMGVDSMRKWIEKSLIAN